MSNEHLLTRMQQIGELLRTQDNRITDAPIFAVQEHKRDYGYDLDYVDDYVWLDTTDGIEATTAEAESFELLEKSGNPPKDWIKSGYRDRWEFVTACFTEQGCKNYIAVNGHNHGGLRIYAYSSFRNSEYRAVRDFLMQTKERLPQRFRYQKQGCDGWDFGVCFPMGQRWSVQAGAGFGSFDNDPWEILGHIIGDVQSFFWIDNDCGWREWRDER